MKKYEIKYLVLSDIHLGHPKNHTNDIIEHLHQFFILNSKELMDLDILFINGDIFDRLLSTRSMEYRSIVSWLSNLLLWCRDNNIIFRVLYGTPSHDNDQMAGFTEVAKRLAPDAKYRYINTLKIEHLEELGIHILYVPDEWRHDSNTTYEEVKALLKEHHIAQVDIAMMHGCFKYQIPMLKDVKFTHIESNYLDITKYYINIGHIHTPSAYERILAPGSFDRLAHGEEEPKGGLLCKIRKDKTMEFKFLENKLATTFKTISLLNIKEDKLIKELKRELKKVKPGSHIRIEVTNDTLILKSLKELAGNYPNLYIKFITDNQVIKKIDILETTTESKAFEINKTNIKDLMLKELNDLSSNELKIFTEELEKAM